MRFLRILTPLLCLASAGLAQLTQTQKTADFMQLVGLYAKNYAPYELRRDVFGFDLYNVTPWLDEINKSTGDIEFYDICTRYIASLQDSHDEFTLPSDFEAWLHMDLDMYDGKVLIGFIDRTYLTRTKYPFAVGDEIVSLDGTAAADLVQSFIPYAVNGEGSKISQLRLAAGTITDRYQGWNPKAAQIGDNATVVVRRQSGAVETYTIPWDKQGTPIAQVGPVETPHSRMGTRVRSGASAQIRIPGRDRHNPWGIWQGARPAAQPAAAPDYMQPLLKLQHAAALNASVPVSAGIFPFDSFTPLFNPPAGFKLRLGAGSADEFLSGTFPAGKNTIGFIRIPSMDPADESAAFSQFVNEMTYFQKNTDGLIIDVMGNGGGFLCYSQELATALIPYKFRGTAEQLRATQNWVEDFSISLREAKQAGAPAWVSNLYAAYLQQVQQALSENRGMTGSLPLCSESLDAMPLTDGKGNNLAYTKPILLLTDSFTLSSAESFAMLLQDSQRATIFGTRTDGGGGNVVAFSSVTNYSEGDGRVTEGLITRALPVATPGFPAGPYSIFYDGMGIYPDIVQDYQTRDNLLNGGQTFVQAATAAMTNLIQK